MNSKEKDMKVQPVTPTISFGMRFKNTDLSYFEQNSGKANPRFKEVMEQVECQPIKPSFKGHWPIYGKIPTDGGILADPHPQIGTGEKLNFKA